MATSIARALPLAPHTRLALLLLLLAHIAPLSASMGGATPNVLVSAHNVNVAAHGAAALTLPEVVGNVGQAGSDDVLVFQTSFDILVPCIFTSIINPPTDHEPPARVVIAAPTKNGTYPVILFKHGFVLANCYYTQIFESLASAGYIVVAPQAVTINTNCTDEIEETADVANWMSESLAVVLTAAMSKVNVVPNMSKLVMAGHSRGGKIAFAMALGMASTKIPSFSALVTLDPVDGTSSNNILQPPIVAAGCNHTRNQVLFPVLILGTGYGSQKRIFDVLPCAPACCGHMAYFNCSSAPTMYHLVASDYGHLDFLDDLVPFFVSAVCKAGSPKEALRDFSSELIVAFLKYALDGDEKSTVDNVIENASIALEEIQIYPEDGALIKEHISKLATPQEQQFAV